MVKQIKELLLYGLWLIGIMFLAAGGYWLLLIPITLFGILCVTVFLLQEIGNIYEDFINSFKEYFNFNQR